MTDTFRNLCAEHLPELRGMFERETFDRPGVRISTWYDGVRNYCCWKPNVSTAGRLDVFCTNRKEVLRFMAWPAKTPTGDALREWLTAIEEADAVRKTASREPQPDLPLSDELLATGWGPEIHVLDETDPNYQTRTIT